jgi:hypothetical protein
MALPSNAPAEQPHAQPARLTGRGAVLGMAVMFTVGLLVASWLGVTMVAGSFFVLGCGLAAWYTRPADLLTVVLTPPLLFSGALIVVEALTASGSLLLSVAAGSVVVLASLALWLAAGLVVTVAIALSRGLPQCIRDLRRDLRADRAQAGPPRRSGARTPNGPPRNPPQRPARPAGPTRPPGSATAARTAPGATRAAARTASAPESPQRPQPR